MDDSLACRLCGHPARSNNTLITGEAFKRRNWRRMPLRIWHAVSTVQSSMPEMSELSQAGGSLFKLQTKWTTQQEKVISAVQQRVHQPRPLMLHLQ